MAANKPINLSAFSEHHSILRLWLYVTVAGLLVFAGTLLFSYFLLNAPALSHESARYRTVEQILGMFEMGGVLLSLLAYMRYLTVKDKYHDRVFHQFVVDNDWTTKKTYGMDKIASTLLSVGESYEQGFGFDGTYNGQPFSCLIFEYLATDSKTRRYLCLSFKLPRSYPMIVIDNKLNNHKFPYATDPDERIPKGSILNLEGDFNRYYQVSTIKDREKEVMVVLSPDFMATLEDHAADKVDIEINNKALFLVYEADHYSEQNITSIFSVADTALNKLNKLSKTWLATNKSDEASIAKEADVARRSMIFRWDWMTAVTALVFFIVFVILMISHVKTEPPCTPSDPCYQGGRVYTGS